MSRIHDALKKAEQERAATGSPAGPTQLDPTPAPPREGSPVMTQGSAATPAWSGIEAPSESLTLEALQQQCPMSNWSPNPRSVLFLDPQDHSLGTEEFRSLRSRLNQIREKQPLQTLLVTSALPGEGKTFVAANLAQVIVQQRGRRVLLIDGDLRFSRLHASLGALASPGLADYLGGEAEPFSILQRGPEDNLFFIAGGKAASNPVELIGNGRLKKLLHRLVPIFDWIILDSPPAVALTDASLLAEMCDGVLMVVRAGATAFDMAQKGRQQFQDNHVVGAVLNHVAPGSAYSAYYYPTGGPPENGENR